MADGILIYWTDGRNPPRRLDVSELVGTLAPPTGPPEDLGVSVEVVEEGPVAFFFWQGGQRANAFNLYVNDELVNINPIEEQFYLYAGVPFTNYDAEHTAYVTGLVDDFEGDPSSSITFEVPVPVPQNFAASTNEDTGDVVFTWDASAHAESYNVYINNVKHNSEPITDTTYEVQLPPGTYSTYVRAVAQGAESAESNIEEFSFALNIFRIQQGNTNAVAVVGGEAPDIVQTQQGGTSALAVKGEEAPDIERTQTGNTSVSVD